MTKYDTVERFNGINFGWPDKEIVKILKRLLKSKHSVDDPSVNNSEVLKWCAYYGRSESVKVLLKDGRVDPTAGDNDIIGAAAHSGDMETVKLILSDKNVDPSANKYYAPYLSWSKGDKEIAQLLLTRCNLDQNTLIKTLPSKYLATEGFMKLVNAELTRRDEQKLKKIGKFKDFLDI